MFRALGVSAMKGNRLSQATMAELVRGIEEEDRQSRVSLFEVACEYKSGWEQAIEFARERGLPEPMPVPHPDDVIVDVRKAEVRYEGPITPEEKKRWDRLLEFRDEQQELVSLAARLYHETDEADAELHANRREAWQQAQSLYDRINDPLPDRYRRRLEDRGYGEGFSREGQR